MSIGAGANDGVKTGVGGVATGGGFGGEMTDGVVTVFVFVEEVVTDGVAHGIGAAADAGGGAGAVGGGGAVVPRAGGAVPVDWRNAPTSNGAVGDVTFGIGNVETAGVLGPALAGVGGADTGAGGGDTVATGAAARPAFCRNWLTSPPALSM